MGSEDDVQLALDALDAAVAEAQEQQSVLATLRRCRMSCHGLTRRLHERHGQLVSLHSIGGLDPPRILVESASHMHVL